MSNMSRDVDYILDYEVQSYSEPTPMSNDKETIRNEKPGTVFTELHHGYTIFCELPKHSLSHETITNLWADKVFEKVDGSVISEVVRR